MNKNMQSDLNKKIDKTWDYWFDETGTVAVSYTHLDVYKRQGGMVQNR